MNTSKLKALSPTILSILASFGVIGTAVLAVKATPDAEAKLRADSRRNHDGDPYGYSKMEAIKSCWKFYIPALGMGTATIACILGANVLNRKQQAALISGYQLIRNTYDEYRSKVRELYGEETDEKIMSEIVKDRCHFEGISGFDICGSNTLGIATDQPEPIRTFYDSYSKRYFDSTLSNVIQAEYHLNRNYSLGAGIRVNDFYEFLGLDGIESGDIVGWTGEDGIAWIDFNHHTTVLNDDMEVIIIDMVFTPSNIEEWF